MISRTLRTVLSKTHETFLKNVIRNQNISTTNTRFYSAYEHDGKTKVSIFNTETDIGLMITGYSQYGFRLNNDMVLLGPIAVFPRYISVLQHVVLLCNIKHCFKNLFCFRSVLSWNINSFEDINEKSLSLFPSLDPRIDVLIIGIGDQSPTPVLSKRIIEFMRNYKINVEVLRTEQV